MWRDLTQLPSLISELITLTREQNALTRELLTALTGRMAQTPSSSAIRPLQQRRQFTDKDVVIVTREALQRDQWEAERRKIMPHAVPVAPTEGSQQT